MEVVSFTFKLRVTVISLFLIIATEDCAKGAFPLEPKDIIFVGLSQPNAYHKGRAEVFRQHLEEQFKDLKHPEQPVIHLLHERWPTTGSWTILPILPSIATVHKMQKWLFVSDVETRLNVTKLLHSLSSYNHDESLFIGRGLHNEEACITYHLRLDIPIAFPDFAAGFLISSELIKIVSERLNAVKPKPEFSIDVKYELALYIHNKGEGVLLTEVSFLCAAEHQEECATTYPLKFPDCGEPVSEDEVFVAVKTCKKFHKTRVPVVQKTWGKQTKHIRYYSEEADESIPTIDVGVPNAEGGHCAKTYAILVRTVWQSHIDNKKWLVITDDDTLLSVPRLRRLLACYDPTEPIALGERYGYGVNANYGYDYVTSGGGMVFSLLTVRQLLGCRCSTPNSPDDMHFGMCLKRLNIPVTHSPLFHQLRPADYAPGYLSSQLPVSFHKHWNCDPLKEYTQWLAADDDRSVDTTKEPHLEL